MELPPFLLDRWIEQKHSANPPIEYDLASSTGPVWTLRELLALSGEDELEALLNTSVSYTSATGTLPLRTAIAALEGVEADEVQVVTGASEALLILFFLAAKPGANVVLPNPGFPANAALAESLGIAVRYYNLRAENQFGVEFDEIRQLVDHDTGLLLVNSPHNPTGAVLSDEEMKRLYDFCVERSIQFVSDQVYHPIYHGPETQSAARFPQATVISDFSKALCLSGLRIGWIIDHDPLRRERYRNARNYFTITANVFGERLAVLALENSQSIYARARHIARENLVLLDQVLAEHGGVLRWLRPRGGMTAFPWLADGADSREFCRRFAKSGVLIVPGDCFGQPSHFRLGFAASGQRFPLAMERLADFLQAESRDRRTS
ncbi:MAG TPA: pyridoxal phosphate-dependent aminotransferase [Lacipirellulaceae bacterium]|nr:pyridoxal phosphate-dependent aminotransferase [Lacipirellulaceae bacterium]